MNCDVSGFKPVSGKFLDGKNRVTGVCPKEGCSSSEKNPCIDIIYQGGRATHLKCYKCGSYITNFNKSGFVEKVKVDIAEDEELLAKVEKVQHLFEKALWEGGIDETKTLFEKRRLDLSLLEELDIHEFGDMACMIPFYAENGTLVALNYRFIKNRTVKKMYMGPKGLGQGIIKEGRNVVVGEGLFNVLSVYQVLKSAGVEDLGVIVCGDAHNLEKLGTDHQWALRNKKKIYIASDYDRTEVGQNAAYTVAKSFPKRTRIFLPPQFGVDWSDLMMEEKIHKYL